MNTSERLTLGGGRRTDTEEVLGSAFRGTLREAQAGDEAAFTRLWRDANPLMVRYLRVIGADDPYDAACEGWITAVRGLTGYTGDEAGWRVWLLACARLRAELDPERQRWASVTPIDRRSSSGETPVASGETAPTSASRASAAMRTLRGHAKAHLDPPLDDAPETDPTRRALGDTITALRALPLAQGEILVLRLAGDLPAASVADVVGSDAETVRRSESRALERLGTEAELLAWSLAAPASPAELADDRVALGAFRSIPRPPAWSVPRTRVVAVGRAPARKTGAHPTRGIANAAGRSRTALLGIAVLSASAMSLGGLSAAAYVGALPTPVQQVMHDTIGAPAPAATRSDSQKRAPGSPPGPRHSGSGSTPVGPAAASSPAVGLCRAWASDKAKGTARESSAAFGNLASTAGGSGKVDAYCATLTSQSPLTAKATTPSSQSPPTARATTPSSHGGKPTTTTRGSTATVPPRQGTGSPTRTPSSEPTKVPNTNSPTKGTTAPSTSSTRTKSPGTSSTRTKSPSTQSTRGKAPTTVRGTKTSTTSTTSTASRTAVPAPVSTTDVTTLAR